MQSFSVCYTSELSKKKLNAYFYEINSKRARPRAISARRESAEVATPRSDLNGLRDLKAA